MKFNVTLDRDEDGVWIVECPSIPGCVSQGQTREEALENIKDAIAACLEVRAELGLSATSDKSANSILELCGKVSTKLG
ncbi:MAG: type II toxin-antitoxin system HicB family antitoxin [Nostoc sp.]|uniref:type II toxin-antitoxin system HicB family antitoxin n=1 Tax=Nostoc sp. TaxID=1180 RepID=UPI002FF055B3